MLAQVIKHINDLNEALDLVVYRAIAIQNIQKASTSVFLEFTIFTRSARQPSLYTLHYKISSYHGGRIQVFSFYNYMKSSKMETDGRPGARFS